MENAVFAGYLCYSGIVYLISTAMRVFPVDEKKVVFITVKGKRYGDNPMYISDELLKKRSDYNIIWLLNKCVDVELPKGVRRVNRSFLTNLYELTTAKVWVDSNAKEYGIRKRKSQLYIQTWHGSYGLKKIGLDLGNRVLKIEKNDLLYNSSIEDIMVSNSDRETEIYRKAFGYQGKVIQHGSPRNDLFKRDRKIIKKCIMEAFNIVNKRIALYAPTQRNHRNGFQVGLMDIDLDTMRNSLQASFGGDWVVLVRLHPQNIEDAKKLIYTDRIINATNYSIMQELLVAADVLITDYSSCMFDFITVPKPCFIYAPDLEEYERDRGNYYRMEELPFPLARNNEELAENIRSFDMEEYTKKVYDLHERVGLCETGHASEAVADCIIDFIENGNR